MKCKPSNVSSLLWKWKPKETSNCTHNIYAHRKYRSRFNKKECSYWNKNKKLCDRVKKVANFFRLSFRLIRSQPKKEGFLMLKPLALVEFCAIFINLKLVFFLAASASVIPYSCCNEANVVEKYVCTYMRTWKLCSLSCSPIEKFMMIRIYNRPTRSECFRFFRKAYWNVSLPSLIRRQYSSWKGLNDVFYEKIEWKEICKMQIANLD